MKEEKQRIYLSIAIKLSRAIVNINVKLNVYRAKRKITWGRLAL